MSDQEFMYEKPNGEWATNRSLGETMDAARKQCESGLKVYTLVRDGKTLRRGARKWVLDGLKRNLEKGEIGDTYRVRSGKEMLFVCREIKAAIHIINTNGNVKADKAWSVAKAEYKDVTFLGAYVCKRILGTFTMSQHSYGNALDFGRSSMSQLVQLANFLYEKRDELDLQHIIVDDRIWTRGVGWSHYGGARHYHVHIDFTPQKSGSCGVR